MISTDNNLRLENITLVLDDTVLMPFLPKNVKSKAIEMKKCVSLKFGD